MQRKIIFGIIAIILIILVVFGIKELITPKIEGNEYFTLEPESWIEKIDYTEDKDDISINLFKATRGNAMVVDNIQEDYNLNGEIISFFYRGGYKGTPFTTNYFAEEFYNESLGKTPVQQEELAQKHLLMKIGAEMDPTDDVINGFMLAKRENEKFVFYIFVDEDWRQKLEYTNILWGDDFNNPASLHLKQFNFQKARNGIYMEKLYEDVDWFEISPVSGGIAVGEINQEILNKILNGQAINQTFMYIR